MKRRIDCGVVRQRGDHNLADISNMLFAQSLQKHGLGRAHFHLLDNVGRLGIRVVPTELSRICVELDLGSSEATPSREAYSEAFDECVRNDWLRVLTREDCESDRARLSAQTELVSFDDDYVEGTVEISGLGQDLLWRVLVDANTATREDENSGWRVHPDGRVDVFAATEAGCAAVVKTLVDDPVSYIGGDDVRVVSVSVIEACGPWWLSRFSRLASGYHAVVRYARDHET